MAPSPLPTDAITWLASAEMRDHHATWHFVRDYWHRMTDSEREPYLSRGWKPPRLAPLARRGDNRPPPPDAGSGIDFLGMHRQMIADLNDQLAAIADPAYPRVTGWDAVPWDHADPEWPMPAPYEGAPSLAKDPVITARWRQRVAERFENDAWLATVTLDEMGREIERGIHAWMHLHWSAAPWFTGAPGQDRNDARNDHLGSTYASHVNVAFWKIHGWIDSLIGRWEHASGQNADLSSAWLGPDHSAHHVMARARLPQREGSRKHVTEAPALALSGAHLILAEQFFLSLSPNDGDDAHIDAGERRVFALKSGLLNAAPSAFSFLADEPAGSLEVIATVTSPGTLEWAVITTGAPPRVNVMIGDGSSKSSRVSTDANMQLKFDFSVSAFPGTLWELTLTLPGMPKPHYKNDGLTNSHGRGHDTGTVAFGVADE